MQNDEEKEEVINAQLGLEALYPDDSQRIMTDGESSNLMILTILIHKMTLVTESLIDGEGNSLAEVWETEDVLTFINGVIAASDCTAFDNMRDNLSLHKHKEACGGTEERRRMAVFKSLHRWKIEDSSAAAVAELMDAVLTQHSFFEEDCCPQDYFITRTLGVVNDLWSKILLALPARRSNIIARMVNSRELGQERLLQLETLSITEASSATSAAHITGGYNTQTIVNRPAFPNIMDLRGRNLSLLVNHVRALILANLPLEVAQWPSYILIYFNNMWGQFERSQSDRRGAPRLKTSWQYFADSQILIALEKFLPENQRASQTSKIKQFEMDFNAPDKQVVLNFGKQLSSESSDFVQQMTRFQIRFSEITEEDPVTEAEEVHLLREFSKSLKFIGIPDKSLNFLRNEIKRVISGCKCFLEMKDFITDLVVDRLNTLIAADNFLPRSYAASSWSSSSSSSPSNHTEWQDRPKAKKQRKHDHASAPSGGSSVSDSFQRPAGDAGKCNGCGWDNKNTKKKGEGGPPGKWVCPRNEMRGCSTDLRRNTSSSTWSESLVGKKWKEAGYTSLPKSEDITLLNAKAKRDSYVPEGKFTFMINQIDQLKLTNELIPFSIPIVQARKRDSAGNKPVIESAPTGNLLLDTGAIGACVVSTSFYDQIVSNNTNYTIHDTCHEINTAMNENTISDKEISFNLLLSSEQEATNELMFIPIRAIVAPISVDVIVDKDTIKNYDLVKHYPSQFANGDLLEWLHTAPFTSKGRLDDSLVSIKRRKKAKMLARPINWAAERELNRVSLNKIWVEEQREISKAKKKAQNEIYSGNLPMSYLATLTSILKEDSDTSAFLANITSNYSQKQPFERDGNLTEIPDNKLESIPAELISDVHGENDYKKVIMEGAPLVKSAVNELVAEFSDLFSSTVQGTPAKLIPFQLKVDTEKWNQPANMLRCRKLDRSLRA